MVFWICSLKEAVQILCARVGLALWLSSVARVFLPAAHILQVVDSVGGLLLLGCPHGFVVLSLVLTFPKQAIESSFLYLH